MLLRILSAGALALALLLPGPASAKGYNIVRGKCLCVVGLAVHVKAKWTRSCDHDCNHPEVRPDLRKSFDAERPQREGHQFRSMWSDSAALAPTDVSSARRMRHARNRSGHRRPVAVAVRASDRDGRYLAAPAAETHQRPRQLAQAAIQGAAAGGTVAVEHSRPRDCYGIAWCGCWLAHAFGLADRSLNLAIRWASMGSPATVDSANVVVWRHHVGRLIAHDNGRILVQSGNDGGAVRTRWLSPHVLGGVVAYRKV